MRKLEKVIQRHDMSGLEWFQQMDSGGGGNGRISDAELREGLAEMCSGKAFRKYKFSSEEIKLLIRCMDSTGDGGLVSCSGDSSE
jgi:hypothetical protein